MVIPVIIGPVGREECSTGFQDQGVYIYPGRMGPRSAHVNHLWNHLAEHYDSFPMATIGSFWGHNVVVGFRRVSSLQIALRSLGGEAIRHCSQWRAVPTGLMMSSADDPRTGFPGCGFII